MRPNLVVAPGFIDVLSYEPNSYGVWYKVGDGVTTNLAMHGINDTAESFFDYYGSDAQRPPVHYGGAFDNPHMRSVVEDLPSKAATPAQIEALEQSFEQAIADGYIGLDIEPEYTPWVTTDEITALAHASRHRTACRSSRTSARPAPTVPDGGSLAALDELLLVAENTGAAVHVDHITSMTTHVMGPAIERIDAARGRGVDVTACLYPYDFWATTLASERFAPGWQERFGIDYGDLEVAGTGERLTATSFERYQAENKLVAAHAIPEEDVQAALRSPWTLIGSDAILEPGDNNHPRCSGCFTRTLGRYVRELGVLSLVDALAKMTILPARRLEGRVPALQSQGAPTDRGRRRHNRLRSRDRRRPIDDRRPSPDGGRRVVRDRPRKRRQGRRHPEQGPSARNPGARRHRVSHSRHGESLSRDDRRRQEATTTQERATKTSGRTSRSSSIICQRTEISTAPEWRH